ncbi:hypothetical protein [Natronococcus sp. A-GB7]|uniref:hypothetical protein n=1 Tax=Natronococcus sp. A-GB7 TaxID=3037649 RepID=UPI00241E9A1C|nr:hypothetical protein [Natronococcus sp. A-GB7]MDG5818051.1 hypothetical protein [Natronococcus sp. A-GB7]
MDGLSDITTILFPTVYVLFFLGTLGVLAFARRRYAREVWLAGFFTTLLAVTLVGMPLLPVVDMHKFAQPSEEEETYYEIRMVDAAGEELRFDDRSTPPTTGTRTSTVAGQMADEYTDEQRLEMGEFYLANAREHRQAVESGDRSVTDRLQPPRYVDDRAWTAAELEGYDSFEAIRIYERTVIYSDDNTAVESNEERPRVTIDPTDGTVTEHEDGR